MREGEIVTVFRNRLRPEHSTEYEAMAPEIYALAAAMPGFLELKTFTADDGERVSIVRFADEATQRAWRDQARHREAQRAGRERFYSAYSIQVCRCLSVREHPAG